MPIAPLLQQFVDGELARSAVLIQNATRDLQASLRASGGTTPAEIALRADLAGRIDRQAPLYQASFVDSLASRVRAELARDDEAVGEALPSAVGGLALMDESRVEIDIEISRASERIDAAAEWELRELQTFTSTLIGQAHVSAESNPLRPMFYAAALWDAACVVHPGQSQRAALLRLAAEACAPLLKKAWAAASTRLEADGVSPGAYRSRVLPSGSMRPARDEATAGTESAALRQLLAALPGGTGVQLGADRFAPTPMPTPLPRAAAAESEAALAELDKVLRELPPRTLSKLQAVALTARLDAYRSVVLASSAPKTDGRQIVDLLSRVFDALVADPDLHPSFLAVVARMQIPALRLALREPSSLASTRHPVWQLLDRIGEASASYPQSADRRGAGLLTLCTRLADELIRQHGADVELCRKALGKLDEYLAAQLQAQRRVAEPQIELLRDAERLETLEREVAQRLAEQMAPLRPDPAVRRFLGGPWARVLATALLRQSEDEEPACSYIRTVDDLLWSVQSPDHPASRQRLAALLPPMLQCLRDGMASIALPAGEQQATLEALSAIHTDALQRGQAADAARPARPHGQSGGAVPLPAATHAPASPPDDRPAPRETMIDVASLETVPAALMPAHADAPAGDAPARQVAALKPGDRARLFVNGRWTRVQLLWRSERGDFLLFAGEALGETHSITRRALERLAAAGLVRALEDQPLSRRAFETVERRLAAAGADAAG